MSGWIKIEKAMTESLRFKRFARALSRSVTRHVTIDAIRDETLALGALVRLWIYADSHISNDNVLEATLDEINEIAGIEGFAQAMPADWLQVIDPNHVKLPEFLEHNGTSARLRKQGAQRQARYRHRTKAASPQRDVTASDALRNASNDARPDQTRPDQSVRDTRADVSRGTFRQQLTTKLRSIHPKGTYGDHNWQEAERAIDRLLDEGVKPEELVAADTAYLMQQTAIGKVGSRFVMSPATFFGTDAWRGDFALPLSPEEQAKLEREKREAAAMQRAKDRASERSCPLTPLLHESAAAFDSRVDTWVANNRGTRSAGPVAIAATLQKAAG